MKSLLDTVVLRPGHVLRNRIALAPLTNRQSNADGTLGDAELRWLARRAQGGFGLIESCATHVAAEGQGFAGQLGIWGEHQVEGWKRLAAAIHGHGAPLMAQLFHAGHRALRPATGVQPASASAGGEGEGAWRALDDGEIEVIIEQFVAAALRAQRAGLDGVEIHGAHGYLLMQFISTDTNRRTDRWGGDLDSRALLIREVARRIRAAVGPDFVVGVRLTPENYGHWKGLDLDESVQIAGWLVEDGVDFIHVSLWDARPNSAKYPDRHTLEVFRAALGERVPIFAAGAIWSREDAERVLELGADVVSLGRAAILNPDWPTSVAHDGMAPTRPPMSSADLQDRDISPVFVDYLRNWKGFVAD